MTTETIYRITMQTYTVHTSTGPVRVLARSRDAARLMIAELEPTATILRIERESDW